MAQQESNTPSQQDRLHLLENIITHTQQFIYNSTKTCTTRTVSMAILNIVYGKLDEMLLLANGDINQNEYDELLEAYPDE